MKTRWPRISLHMECHASTVELNPITSTAVTRVHMGLPLKVTHFSVLKLLTKGTFFLIQDNSQQSRNMSTTLTSSISRPCRTGRDHSFSIAPLADAIISISSSTSKMPVTITAPHSWKCVAQRRWALETLCHNDYTCPVCPPLQEKRLLPIV